MVALTPGLPLLLSLLLLLPTGRGLWLRLAPLAPLPALVLALTGASAQVLDLPWLLLGTRLGLDDTGRFFLLFTALTWLAAGVYGHVYMNKDARRWGFWAFFLITQAGNLGVCLAQDAATFYLFFALMTFAAYGLVVHTRTEEAWRAGRVYLAMAVLGEVALVAGLMLAAHAAGSLYLTDLGKTVMPVSAVGLLILGFGVKVGLPLLHLWLPLAHPVAPVPASAVLSGVMLKAGLLGWLRFLPLGHQALPEAGAALMALGLLAMFYGVVVGLVQRDIKVVLAYSSVSQLGFMTLGVGAGLFAPWLWPVLLPAVGLYALHHALAKSALFLAAGVALQLGGRPWLLAGLALPALALAGAPFTSGWLAKTALKDGLAGLPSPWGGLLGIALPLAAVGTTLLMARLLWLTSRLQGRPDHPMAPTAGGPEAVVTPQLQPDRQGGGQVCGFGAGAALARLDGRGHRAAMGDRPGAGPVRRLDRPCRRHVARVPGSGVGNDSLEAAHARADHPARRSARAV
jgi:formate hydrogenlyase subunit 3/multisubunit Na+/H+ antiporter MnhD subunit